MAIYLQLTHVSYVLEPVEPINRPSSWEQENISVCSVITRTIHPANYCYICECPKNAATMWNAIKEAHQDSSSGGRMFWLCKLVQAKMTTNLIEAHIDDMNYSAEKLKLLVTAANPLTADNIYSTALLTSLPNSWLNCVSAMMSEERVSSVLIISALKAESLRQKSRGGEENPISVAKAEASTNQSGKLFCKFCKCAGHDLLTCNNAEKVLKGHKEACHQEFLAKQNPETSKSNKPNQSGKLGKKPARRKRIKQPLRD
jgi:hypothetical protein